MSLNESIYDCKEVLGKGSFGLVVKATNKQTGATVVVKKQNAKLGAQAQSEKRVMQNLIHRNIVRFIDYWVSESQTVNIVMEYCDGGDLRTVINQHEKMGKHIPEEDIRRWIGQVASALYYCHVQHVLHRDLKPENVLLHQGDVKVADFGLARSLRSTTDFATTRLGTVFYLPPEVVGAAPYNNRADMWSLGILLFELLTLKKPFSGKSISEICQSITGDPVPSLQAAATNYSAELVQLCQMLLDKYPMKRPSARQILDLDWIHLSTATKLTKQQDDERSREEDAWRRVTVVAKQENSTMLEMFRKRISLNVRQERRTTSPKVGTLQYGDIVEEISRSRDNEGVLWLQIDGGYCIANIPQTSDQMFRPLPEWRVQRPSAAAVGTESMAAGESTMENDDGSAVAEMVEKVHISIATDDDLYEEVSKFLSDRIPGAMLADLLEKRRLLCAENEKDDMAWTVYACDTLRKNGLVSYVQAIRSLSMLEAKKK